MEKVRCKIHDLDIVIYEKDEEYLFVDDNKEEVAIFYDNNGKRYLKRYKLGKCDGFCETTRNLMEQPT